MAYQEIQLTSAHAEQRRHSIGELRTSRVLDKSSFKFRYTVTLMRFVATAIRLKLVTNIGSSPDDAENERRSGRKARSLNGWLWPELILVAYIFC